MSLKLQPIMVVVAAFLLIFTQTVISRAVQSGGWIKIEPGGDTACAHGTPYAFWVRIADPTRLLIFLQGGGGCWSAETCAPGSSFYAASVDDSDHPETSGGILDVNHPDNPFADYSMVYIPSCTGDVHWGDHVQTYRAESGDQLVIHHKGFVNMSAALEYAYEHLTAPETVFVTGCSAGSVGSILAAPYLIEHYPQARVVQLGDSLSFAYHRPLDLQTDYHAHDNFPDWIPALDDIRPGEFTMDRFYSVVANAYPENTFAQYNTAYDQVQERFFVAVGGPADGFNHALEASLSEIHANAPNFRSYTAAGELHCILPRNSFYTLETEGISVRDWVADLAAGNTVEDVHCTDCE